MKLYPIKVEDRLKPDPLWNETSRPQLQLPDECEILEIKKTCNGNVIFTGSGIMFKVQLRNGKIVHLDSAWFILPKNCPERNTGLKNMLRKRRVQTGKPSGRRNIIP